MATISKEVQEWIEEQVWKPVDDWVKRTEKKCKEYDWWNPIGWFCRKIVLRLPRAERNICELQAAAKEGTRGLASSSSRAAAPQESVKAELEKALPF